MKVTRRIAALVQPQPKAVATTGDVDAEPARAPAPPAREEHPRSPERITGTIAGGDVVIAHMLHPHIQTPATTTVTATAPR